MEQQERISFERLCDELYRLTEQYPESAAVLEAVQLWAWEETVASRQSAVPLTPEQLRKKTVEPVWIEYEETDGSAEPWHWHLLVKVLEQSAFLVSGSSARIRLSMDDYGRTWRAYDRQPRGIVMEVLITIGMALAIFLTVCLPLLVFALLPFLLIASFSEMAAAAEKEDALRERRNQSEGLAGFRQPSEDLLREQRK